MAASFLKRKPKEPDGPQRQEIPVLEADAETGLSAAQAQERLDGGWGNAPVESPGASVREIIAKNVFTYFNFLFFLLAGCVIAVRQWLNLTFLGPVFCNMFIGIVQDLRVKKKVDGLKIMAAPKCLADLLGISPMIGLCTGSIPMVGGHGTAGAFGPVLEDFGVAGATTLCTAAATYGLIAGSVMGGPTGRLLIERRKLLDTVVPEDDSLLVEEEIKHERHTSMYPAAVFQLIIAIGIGTFISKALAMTGLTFPIYIGAMIAAACMRNIGEFTHKFTTHMGEINDIGGISLSLFLGIAMITLKLWQLAALALPLIILLAGQTLLIFLFTYFVIFNIMGRDYDAAVIAAGVCGFGMGATPNAMANMQALCEKYAPSVKAYLLIPLVGSLFADFLNSLVITFFINFI